MKKLIIVLGMIFFYSCGYSLKKVSHNSICDSINEGYICFRELKNQYSQGEKIKFIVENKTNSKLYIKSIRLEYYDEKQNTWYESIPNILASDYKTNQKNVWSYEVINKNSFKKVEWNPVFEHEEGQKILFGDTIVTIYPYSFHHEFNKGKHRLVFCYLNSNERTFVWEFEINK